ncbi:hypothetical protein K439DRAFT_1645068 [Ramaria rubella]|nr:hypothetical protein K439DRAFT_1645068 [Ramaria rubella]
METLLNVRLVADDPPHGVEHIYHPSADGVDENLLILLHGLGDTHVPFSKLGKQLHLPQTATLSLRAPEKVPYLYEEAYQWYESFDSFGELLTKPNPSRILEVLEKLINHLVQDCHWAANKIHFFGFGQGGSVTAELTLRWWKAREAAGLQPRFGSLVSVAGPLLSYPTLPRPCTTPVLVFHRPQSEATKLTPEELTAFKKGYERVQEVKGGKGEGMARSREDWEPMMKFWSETLSKRSSSGMYEVLGV